MAVTRVDHIVNPAAVVVTPSAGEFLFFRVKAGGPLPKFQLASNVKGMILNQGRFAKDPTTLYEWAYLKDPSDIQQLELLSMAFVFVANAKYRYQVSVNGPGGKIRDVLDIDYAGTALDFDTELFRVVIH
jgi:hypothetical protein